MLCTFKWHWFLNCPQDVTDGIISPAPSEQPSVSCPQWAVAKWSDGSLGLMARQLADDIFRFSWIRISVFWLTFYWHSFILEQFMMTSSNENIFALLAFVRGIHRPPVNSHLNGRGRVAVMFSLTCAWINGWVNNRNKDGDLRRYRAHYEVTGMCRGAKHASNHHRNQYWSCSITPLAWRQQAIT